MAKRPVEKHYGKRTLQRRPDGYVQMSIPQSVVDDPKTGFEAGERVAVRGIITGDGAYIRLQRVDDE